MDIKTWWAEDVAISFRSLEEWLEIIWKTVTTSRYVNPLYIKCIKLVILREDISLNSVNQTCDTLVVYKI